MDGVDAGAKAVIQNLQQELAKLGASGSRASSAIATGMQAGIQSILNMARTIDVTNKATVADLRATAASVRDLSVAAGVAPAEIQKLAVAEQVLSTRIRQATQDAKAQAQAILGTGNNLNQISPKARTAANAFTSVAFAATGMTGGLQGGVIAAGTLATSLATMSTSANIAAGASGIGALLVVLGALVAILNRATSATADMTSTLDDIKSARDVASIEGIRASIDAQLAVAKAKLDAFNQQTFKPPIQGAKLKAEVEGLTAAAAAAYKQFVDLLGQEGERAGEKATAEAKQAAEKAIREAKQAAEKVVEANRNALREQQSLRDETIQNILRSQDKVTEAEKATAAATRQRRLDDLNATVADASRKAFVRIDIERAYDAQIAAIDRAAAERKKRLQLDALNDQRQSIAVDLSVQRAEIEQRAAVGLISQRDAEREIAAIERARVPQLQALADAMLQLGEATKDQSIIDAAKQLSSQIGSLGIEKSLNAARVAAVNFKDDAIDALGQDLAQFLGSGINQIHSMSDAFRSLALAAVQSIQQIIAQLIALRAAQVLTGLLSGGVPSLSGAPSATQLGASGIPSAPPSLGPMSPIGNLSVPSLSLNDFSSLSIPSFTASQQAASAGPGGFGGNETVTIKLAPGLIAEEMRSRTGRRIVIEHLAENPKAVNTVLGRGTGRS